MPAAKKTDKIEIMDAKSVALIKRARKQMRKLRKRAVKTRNETSLSHATKLIEILDTIVANQKSARATLKAASDTAKK